MADIGPVEYVVVGYAGNRFTGEIAPPLLEVIDAGLVRVLDIAVVSKDADGTIEMLEIQELSADVAAAFGKIECPLRGLLSEGDLDALADDLEPDSSVAALLVEHVGATRFAEAVRGAGGSLIFSERIPHAAVEEARASLSAATG
jgi:hypothetical protein